MGKALRKLGMALRKLGIILCKETHPGFEDLIVFVALIVRIGYGHSDGEAGMEHWASTESWGGLGRK